MNDHAQEIRTRTRAIIDAGWYLQQRPRWESVVTVAQEITEHTDALAAQLAEAEARLSLVTPLVRAAVRLWEARSVAGDYPEGDPEVQAAHERFYRELFDLEDLHYDELDWLDGDLPDAARGEADDAR